MKLWNGKKMTALLLAAIMLLAFAPLASAAVVTAQVAVTSTTKVYYAPDTARLLVTLTAGESVGILDEHTSGYYYVYVLADNGEYMNGYMPKGTIPTDATASSVAYNATITVEGTSVFKYYDGSAPIFRTLSKGATVGVIRSVGNYYFVKSDVFYGYVLQSSCVASGATATAAVTKGTTFDLNSADIACYAQVHAGAALYTEPSKTSAIKGTFNTGGAVGVIAQSGTATDSSVGFYYITSGGDYKGYVESTALVIDASKLANIPTYSAISSAALATGTTAASNTAKVANCTSWVSMRQSAKSSSKRLAKVPLGASVTVLGTSGKYTKVTYNKTTGFILSTYIKK